MDTATIVALVTQVATGPVVALVVTLVILSIGIAFIWKWMIPFIEKILDKHNADLATIIQEHREDRSVFRDSITTLSESIVKIDWRILSLEEKTTDIDDKLDEILNKK